MATETDWCPDTADKVLPRIRPLLPVGPAWDAVDVSGTVPNLFWRSIAATLAYAERRICDWAREFYCTTATESASQWAEEYGFDNTGSLCDVYPDLCAKVAAYGGQTCDYFVDVAARLGWVISCDDMTDASKTLPRLGFAQAGCCRLGPKCTPIDDSGASCGNPCSYGPAADYPQPELFEQGSDRSAAICTGFPGFALGQATCCLYAGYFELTDLDAVEPDMKGCDAQSVYIFDVPQATTYAGARNACRTDSTGKFFYYTGYAFQWKVTVDIAASTNTQKSSDQFKKRQLSYAGQMAVGCTVLNTLNYNAALCFLESIKPAHTVISYELINN